MTSDHFPIDRYLERTALRTLPHPDEKGLEAIHAAQAFAIPFENLDIHLGRTISLEPENLISKLLYRNRGGYCFELNKLLHLALKAAGFTVHPVLARVLYGRPEPGAFTHEVLIVTISEQEWLADVGFGGPGLRLPLPMMPDRIFEQFSDRYRLRCDPNHGWVLQRDSGGTFIDLYAFKDRLALDVDIEMSNHFTSTWPGSIFRNRRICSLPKPWGRITLSDMELGIHRDGRSMPQTLLPGVPYMEALAEHFGIILDAEYTDFVL